MMLHSWISTELSYRLGWKLLNSLWQGAAIAAVTAIWLGFLQRRAARARYFSLVLALFAVICAFAITFAIGPDSRSQPNTSATDITPIDDRPAVSPSAALPGVSPLQLPTTSQIPSVAPRSSIVAARSITWMESLSPSIAILWLVGVAMLLVWRAAGWIAAQRLRVLGAAAAPAILSQIAHRVAERLQLRQSFEVLVSQLAATPMVIGWIRPVILVPASAVTGLSASQLEAIIAHELAHIRRHDYLVNLLQIAAETLMFYHPALWWISSQIRLEREHACDDVALEVCADRCEYAGALAALEELRSNSSFALAANGTGGRQLLARVRRILGTPEPGQRSGLPGVVAACTFMAVCAAMIHSPPTRADSSPAATQPFAIRNDAPKLSPFTAVRWHGHTPEVQFEDNWYQPVSINDISVDAILAYLHQSNDFAPERHFAEDLVEVMRDMGSHPGYTVKLQLRTVDTHQLMTFPSAPMTPTNRRSVYDFDHTAEAQRAISAGGPTTVPFVLHNDAPRLSPFTAVRWSGEVAEVQYRGEWWGLVSINDIPAAKILDYLKQSNDFAPKKHFAEDLVEVMRDMGDEPGSTVKLVLSKSNPDMIKEVPAASLTEENRRAVLEFDQSGQERPPAQAGAQPIVDNIFRFDVAFEQGITQFLNGDQISVSSVRGTEPDMNGGICCISGTYKLSSHDTAMIGVSVTAAEAKYAVSASNNTQSMAIQKGTGTFTLLLPISIRDWPHVSFYNDHESFGAIYVGTGDSVLRQ